MRKLLLTIAFAVLPMSAHSHDGKDHPCDFNNLADLTQIQRAYDNGKDICIIKPMYGEELVSRYVEFRSGERITCTSMLLLDPNTGEPIAPDILDDDEKDCYETHLEQRQKRQDTDTSIHMKICRVYYSKKCN